MPVSKSQVRKAGSVIRKYGRGECSKADYDQAIEVINLYRDMFKPGLKSLSNSLRSYSSTLGLGGQVSQRLKTTNTIVEKLERERGLDLSRMRDIGGSRLVVPGGVEDVYKAAEHIRARRDDQISRVIDYISSPRQSGYWAIHVELKIGSLPYEIQLRTRVQHSWAETSEALSKLFGKNYKCDGDSDVHRFLLAQAKVHRLTELGKNTGADLMCEYRDRLAQLSDLLNRG